MLTSSDTYTAHDLHEMLKYAADMFPGSQKKLFPFLSPEDGLGNPEIGHYDTCLPLFGMVYAAEELVPKLVLIGVPFDYVCKWDDSSKKIDLPSPQNLAMRARQLLAPGGASELIRYFPLSIAEMYLFVSQIPEEQRACAVYACIASPPQQSCNAKMRRRPDLFPIRDGMLTGVGDDQNPRLLSVLTYTRTPKLAGAVAAGSIA